jgi:predicted nucleic acid-binding protein
MSHWRQSHKALGGANMKKTKIYLDTSVISHLDAPETPGKMKDTLRLWEKIQAGVYEVVLSEVVFTELARCREPKFSHLMSLVGRIKHVRLEPSDDMVSLASKFVDFGILREKSINDCRHIAAALLSGCDIIVSWNFKHIVNAKTIRGTKVIATTGGYGDIIICTPTMLLEEDDD